MQILGNVVFQSTLPRRERLQQADILEMMSKFQSTLPRRERLKFVHRVQNFPHFNPRSREGSDVHRSVDFIEVCLFQSTLPRRERLFAAPSSFPNLIFQSTLPRRERPSRAFNSRWQRTFQSTLPRRERHGIKTITDAFAEFQSTLPRRERLLPEHRLHRLLQISIHAPAKGATAEWMLWEIDHRNFNPRSREGSDGITHPIKSPGRYFNPRSREGSDPKAGANQDQR